MKGEIRLIPVIYVVYKSKSSVWKGFCMPYDVTCHAKTAEKAKERLENLVKLYEEGLAKYHSPKHLVLKELSDEENKALFKKIWPKISEKIREDIKRYKTYQSFLERNAEQRKEFIIKSNDQQSFIEYSQKPLALA